MLSSSLINMIGGMLVGCISCAVSLSLAQSSSIGGSILMICNSCKTLIGVHEMHGRMHITSCNYNIFCWPMIIKTLVARQQSTI